MKYILWINGRQVTITYDSSEEAIAAAQRLAVSSGCKVDIDEETEGYCLPYAHVNSSGIVTWKAEDES